MIDDIGKVVVKLISKLVNSFITYDLFVFSMWKCFHAHSTALLGFF